MKFHTLKSDYVDVEFASVDELIRSSNLEDGYVNPQATAKQAASRREVHESRRAEAAAGRDDYYEGISTEEVLAKNTANPPDWLINGGKRCLASINAAVGNRLQTPAKRRRRIGVEDGDTVNIDRFLMRSPEPWERMEQHRNTTPIIRITFDMVTSGGARKEDLLWRGAAAVASAMQIERLGGRCEIVGINVVTTPDKDYKMKKQIIRVMIKPAHVKAPLSSTLFASAHVGFYRFVVVQAINSLTRQGANGGHGHCHNTTPQLLTELGSDIHIPRRCKTEAEAIATANDAARTYLAKSELAA